MTKREARTQTVIAIALVAAILVIIWSISAHGGERVRCSARPGDGDAWHYRTKIPGYAHGARDDKCWYIGARMKPRGQLYWSAEPPSIDPPEPVIMNELPAFERRWRGAPYGWEHKE